MMDITYEWIGWIHRIPVLDGGPRRMRVLEVLI